MSLWQLRVGLTRLFPAVQRNYVIPVIGRSMGFFNRKSKDEETMELPDVLTEKRKHKSGQDAITMNENLRLLRTKGKMDTKKEYRAPTDVEARIRHLTAEVVDLSDGTPWDEVPLTDPLLKYKLLSRFMTEFNHTIPNSDMTDLHTVGDALAFFQTDVKSTNRLEDLSKLDLPKNLHIQMEYLRFDPETDTMFGGKTAFPGDDTPITSIKYKRKYKSIKTTTEKPGYVNHYYGY